MPQRPRITWQDSLNVASLLLTVAIARAEDIPFLAVYSVIACACAIVGIWSHHEITRRSRWIFTMALLIVIASLDVSQFRSLRQKELASSHGSIKAANEAQPLSHCPVPVGATVVYAGDSAAWTTQFPFTALSIGGHSMVEIEKDADGGILVNADVFDDRSNLIARIQRNAYAATNYSSDFKRPDKSSLVVYDHAGNIALYVRFVNDNAIRIEGIFYGPGGRTPVKIIGNKIVTRAVTLNRYCMGGARTAFAF